MKKLSWIRPFALFVILIIVGAVILLLRNPSAIFYPSLYSEDGSWSEFIWRIGSFRTYFEARRDYLVVGNVFLLHMAILLDGQFGSGGGVDQLPEFVAAVSIVFLASVAAFPVVALRAYLPISGRIIIWVCILLLPMGTHLNEMIGRLSNAGYSFALLGTLALAWRQRFGDILFSVPVLLLDVLIILCCLTNPVTIAVATAYLALATLHGRRVLTINNYVLVAGIAVAGYATYTGLGAIERPPAVFTTSGLIIAGLARPLLYPFLFPWYHQLSHTLTLCLSFFLISFLAYGWWISRSRLALGTLLAALFIVTCATAILRPELDAYLQGYRLSFPDRYFHAQNMLVLIAAIWASSELICRLRRPTRLVGYIVPIGVLVLFGTHLSLIFETRGPRYQIRTGPSFGEQLRRGTPSEEYPGFRTVEIYPPGWLIAVPERFIRSQ